MSEPCCAFIKPDGQPCAARPLPNRPFCLFHDPAQADRLTEARRKGGATPRRRLRRFPRLLDHLHVGELLSELFIDALNQADPTDTRTLHALNQLARTLLKAVGTRRDQYREYEDRSEPVPSSDHLLRIYPPLPTDVGALLDVELPNASFSGQPPVAPPPPEDPRAHTPPACPASTAPSDPPDPSNPSEPPDLPRATPDTEARQDAEQDTNKRGTGHPATQAGDSLPLHTQTSEHLNTESRSPVPLSARMSETPTPEQGPNRCGTGTLAATEPVLSVRSDCSVRSIGHPPQPAQTPPTPEPPAPAPLSAAPVSPADEPPPEPEPRHILVSPYAPLPGTCPSTSDYVIVDFPSGPTGPSPH